MKRTDTRNPPLSATLFWLSLAAFACTGTMYAARALGADWRLSTALGLGAGIWTLVVGGLCCTASGYDDEAER